MRKHLHKLWRDLRDLEGQLFGNLEGRLLVQQADGTIKDVVKELRFTPFHGKRGWYRLWSSSGNAIVFLGISWATWVGINIYLLVS